MKITRKFVPDANRYIFDFMKVESPTNQKMPLAQIDTYQDAEYFGVWTNPFKRQIITYAEGDITIQKGESEKEYKRALIDAILFYRDGGKCFIDPMCNDELKAELERLGMEEFL